MMDIGFYDRSIDAELLAVLQVEFHGGLHHEMIDGCQRGRGEPVEGAIESVVLGNGVTVELRKGAQGVVSRRRESVMLYEEMRVGPSEPLCRGRLQTAISCYGLRAAVVNVMVKRRGI